VDLSDDGSNVIKFETGVIGKQANGAVMTQSGETVVYTTACATDAPGDFDFIPLRVDYQERFSAAGLTKGGYLKRDGRPSDDEILVSRFIDRPLRPMIAEGWTHDTQLLSWVLSYDGQTVPDSLAICGAAASLALSDIPLQKPVAAVELCDDPETGELIVNPNRKQLAKAELQMMLAGTKDGVLMIEGFANFAPESRIIEAVETCHSAVRKICLALEDWAPPNKKEKRMDTLMAVPAALKEALYAELGDRVTTMLQLTDPNAGGKDTSAGRSENMALCAEAVAKYGTEYGETPVKVAFKKLCGRKMRELVRDTGKRCDGRSVTEVRPIDIDVRVLKHTHGSALFTRGETQAIATVTLGDANMEQKTEDLDGSSQKRFYLQYSFPPSSVGEVGRFGGVGRREVGHGNLAERALLPSIPKRVDFPYSMRVESLITESSGSSSMASVCGGSLAMMDAAVPLTRMVAGVAMGLILDEDEGVDPPIILTDILGMEDALGTMDFKVAGDAEGISAFQLDIKCEGLEVEVLRKALEQARVARLHVLGEMKKCISEPNTELPETVPRMMTLPITAASVPKIIGSGGKVIRSIIEDYGLQSLAVSDETLVATISGFNSERMEAAKALVEKIVADSKPREAYSGPLPEVGEEFFKSEVVSVKNFGLFVKLAGDKYPDLEGLVHISELHTERVQNIMGFMKPGNIIDVMVIGVKDGKLSLSRKALLEKYQRGAKETKAAPAVAQEEEA